MVVFTPVMSEPVESVVGSVSKDIVPRESTQLEEQAPPPPYENLEAGRPEPSPTPGPWHTRPTRPTFTNVLIRSLSIMGYCSLVALCTVYGYTDVRTHAIHAVNVLERTRCRVLYPEGSNRPLRTF
ncbi:hypothetical protein BDM02DRAFT_3108742 [Thelephora ganbajun]|uniref:Uncharacterized protein n=1 Tax=Thelephora ganbajun TaxID=370292 RepID=A0ACB6ZS36_THEGA|nr:hypothetical protein BDM02DRAFT_3108742 [Thelephora ganbajun]